MKIHLRSLALLLLSLPGLVQAQTLDTPPLTLVPATPPPPAPPAPPSPAPSSETAPAPSPAIPETPGAFISPEGHFSIKTPVRLQPADATQSSAVHTYRAILPGRAAFIVTYALRKKDPTDLRTDSQIVDQFCQSLVEQPNIHVEDKRTVTVPTGTAKEISYTYTEAGSPPKEVRSRVILAHDTVYTITILAFPGQFPLDDIRAILDSFRITDANP